MSHEMPVDRGGSSYVSYFEPPSVMWIVDDGRFERSRVSEEWILARRGSPVDRLLAPWPDSRAAVSH